MIRENLPPRFAQACQQKKRQNWAARCYGSKMTDSVAQVTQLIRSRCSTRADKIDTFLGHVSQAMHMASLNHRLLSLSNSRWPSQLFKLRSPQDSANFSARCTF